MIVGDAVILGGKGQSASIFAYADGMTQGLTCKAVKGSKVRNGVWTSKQIETSHFKYIKWHISKVRLAQNVLQASEFKFIDSNGTAFTWDIASITASLPPAYSGEIINKLVDGNTDTKYCTSEWGGLQTGNCDVIIQLNNTIDLSVYNRYQYYTANDSTERDPISWTLSVSNDGVDWTAIDERNNQTITTTRYALAGTWTIATQSLSITINGYLVSNIDEYGTWTVSCTGYSNKTVNIDIATEYTVQMSA